MHTVPMFAIAIQWSQQVPSYCQQTYCWWNRWMYLVYAALDLTQPNWMSVKLQGSLWIHIQIKKWGKAQRGCVCSISVRRWNAISCDKFQWNCIFSDGFIWPQVLYQLSPCHQILNVLGRLLINADLEVTTMKRKAPLQGTCRPISWQLYATSEGRCLICLLFTDLTRMLKCDRESRLDRRMLFFTSLSPSLDHF